MAFLQPQSSQDAGLAGQILQRYGFTALSSKEGPAVYAVSDELLEELAQNGVNFTLHSEDTIKDVLSEKGLDYYEYLLEHHPELLLFNASLPPADHLVMSIRVPDYLVPAAQKLLEEFNPASIEVSETTTIMITPDSDAEIPAPLSRIEFVVHRDLKEAIFEALFDAGIAGYSRETMVITERDPDKR